MPGADVADSIILGGKIYTLNPGEPWAAALAVRRGKIIAVGSDTQIQALRGSRTEVIDAAGHLVLPGFTDTHLHLRLEPSRALYYEFLANTIEDVQGALRSRVSARPDEAVILGWALLAEQASTTGRRELDTAVPDRRSYLRRAPRIRKQHGIRACRD